jgi:hypothetical protein
VADVIRYQCDWTNPSDPEVVMTEADDGLNLTEAKKMALDYWREKRDLAIARMRSIQALQTKDITRRDIESDG